MSEKCYSCLHPAYFGLAIGIVWGLGVFIVGILGWISGTYAHEFIELLASLYVGYDPTFLGSIVGLIWGFVDGFIMGLVLALIYNGFMCYVCPVCPPSKEHSEEGKK